jgi:hypothetical protein
MDGGVTPHFRAGAVNTSQNRQRAVTPAPQNNRIAT